jgi:AcrR family transcriptional regulator
MNARENFVGPAQDCGLHLRRRGAVLEQAIFDAVFDQIQAVGLGSLTMEGIAARAHTGKAALYRRWNSVEDLVVDALDKTWPSVELPPDNGDLRSDIEDILGRFVTVVNGPSGGAMQCLMGELDRNHEFAKTLHERVLAPRKTLMLAVLQRAADRGDIPASAVTPMICDVGPSMLMHQLLAEGPPIDPAYTIAVVDQIVMPLLRVHQAGGLFAPDQHEGTVV